MTRARPTALRYRGAMISLRIPALPLLALSLPGLCLVACTDDAPSTSASASETHDGDGDPTGDGDGDGECPTPLPDDFELGTLGFGVNTFFEMTPGSGRTFEVGATMCCVFWEPVETCAVFSVEPADAGATIDPETGEFTLADDVADSTEFEITGDIEDGRATITTTVFAYVPELHPLKGTYSEVARIPCDDGPEFVPSDPIRELRFWANGSFEVTWEPFEIYVDYWGDYVHDLDTGALTMTPTGGNYVPDDVEGAGTVSFEANQIVMTDMWLGTSQNPVEPAGCGHRFE